MLAWLRRLADVYFRLLDHLLVVLMAAMVAMVLGNVVLRYGFNSGITVSEELSRFGFVWLTFLGAVAGAREGSHLGVDLVVRKLPHAGRAICLAASEALIVLCCVLFFVGTWAQREVNLDNLAPVTEIPLEWVYAVAYVCSASIGAIALVKLVRLATGRLSDDEMVIVANSEERVALETPEAAR
jgi:TRAP-type transport system small permease protein